MKSSKRRRIRISLWEILIIVVSLSLIVLTVILALPERRETPQLEVMERRLRRIRRLGTVSQSYRSVIYMEEKNFWRGDKMVLFTVEHHVLAGIDLSQGMALRELADGSVEVTMPPAQVFSVDADESSIHQMLLREGVFNNPIRIGDYMPQIITQGELNLRAALEDGILDRAKHNARSAVSRVLGLGGFENVRFVDDAGLNSTGGIPAPEGDELEVLGGG